MRKEKTGIKDFFTKRIQRQFLYPFLLLILLTGVVVAGTSYWFSLNNTTSAMTDNVEQQMESMSDSFDTLFDSISHNANRYAEDETLQSPNENSEDILNRFGETQAANPYILNIYMGEKETQNMFIYPEADLGDDYDPTTRPWFTLAEEQAGEVIWTEPYEDAATGDTIVSAARAIEQDGATSGVFAIDFTVNTLFEMINDVKVGETGNAMLLSDTGVYLAHHDEELIGTSAEGEPFYKDVMGNESGSYQYDDGGEQAVAYATNEKTGWKMVGTVQVSDFVAQANSIILPIVLVLIGVIVLSLIIAILLTRYLTKPIKQLQQSMSEAGKGNFSIQANIERNDEIGELSRDFDQMILSIRSLIHQVKHSSNQVSSSAENVVANSEENTAAAHEISRAIQEIASGAQSQTEMMDYSVQSSQTLAHTIKGVVGQSKSIKVKSDQLLNQSEEAKEIVEKLRNHSNQTTSMTSEMRESIKDLQNSSDNINQVVSTISGIAGQTNLLALNAAIEAARAGEAGKGFAVVAEEVRKLAEQSEKALTDVASMIAHMQDRTKDIVRLIEETGEVVAHQEVSVNETEKSFTEVFENVSGNVAAINDIISSMKQMDNQKEQLLENIDGISTVTEDTAAAAEQVSASVQESNAAMEQLNHLAEDLEKVAASMEDELKNFQLNESVSQPALLPMNQEKDTFGEQKAG
ncbi:methyl-accepting chemotaxis protein [Halobacillus sp. B23F22_1]|uniref:methyl-accepting chemotaxis protein n=1 Tax=Halobacillus sp. B23F22_1 TaxID=3459514 RepID=UPI00373E0644